MVRWIVLLLAGLAAAVPAAAQTASVASTYAAELRPEAVDVALVLLSDVSGSVNDGEFHLEKQGYRAAFADPGVVAAIRSGMRRRIAVAYMEFAGARQQHIVVGWTILANGRDARGFGEAIAVAPRSFAGRTSISDGILAALSLLRRAPFLAQRRVIDVCGDGANNSGPAIAAARAAAARARVAVNAIAIINKWPEGYLYGAYRVPGGLTRYFRDQVIGGQGSFVLEAKDFASFAEAMRRKLRQEIAWR
ncbi:MAG: DUF1194 domain-containing protein [Rhodospirillales bacterium]|nr:DUF1194 domain-containing protein [Rhodospirillales bacterium]